MVRSDSNWIGLGQTLAGAHPKPASLPSSIVFFFQAWPLTPAYGAIFGHVLGSLAAFFVSSVYLLAQANIQATAELEKAKKASEDETPKGKPKARRRHNK